LRSGLLLQLLKRRNNGATHKGERSLFLARKITRSAFEMEIAWAIPAMRPSRTAETRLHAPGGA